MKIAAAIKKFLGSTTNLIIVFVSGMLIPNIVLAVTEPYGFTTIVASLLIPAGFYIVWATIYSRPGVMILWAIPFMILCAFQLVISYLFGNSIIAVDMFTNIFTTNVSEAGELLASIYPAVILVCVIYIPIIILAARSSIKKQTLERVRRRNGLRLGFVILAAGCIFAAGSDIRNRAFAVKYHIFPANVCYNTKLSVKRWVKSKSFHDTSKDFKFNAVKKKHGGQREVYVLVIGEAARAASWSLFGYERETTPHLRANSSVIPLNDVITESNTTHKSVPIILSPVSAENYDSIYYKKSIVSMFKEAGFKTIFISNQMANRSFIEFFGHEADEFIDLTLPGKTSNEDRYDEEIIPEFERALSSSDEDLFIVIHTYGSHATHFKRYPRSFARFTPDEVPKISVAYKDIITNAYDNSIAYTDYVLNGFIKVLENAGVCSALLYCSDHGEDLMDDDRKKFLHASPTTTYYQLHIAALAWLSDEYNDLYPDKADAIRANSGDPGTTSHIFHTIGDMASVESGVIDPTRSFASRQWINNPHRMYINDYNEAVNVLNTGLTDMDMKMFDRHGLAYDPNDRLKISY